MKRGKELNRSGVGKDVRSPHPRPRPDTPLARPYREDDIVEEIKDFQDLMHANAFARAYVRDSIERGRVGGAVGREVLENWFAFGEDAIVVDAGEDGWKSATELEDFAASPATPMERDWRAIDPRRLVEDDDEEL